MLFESAAASLLLITQKILRDCFNYVHILNDLNMNNPKVKEGITDILSKFEDPDLLSLANTCTQGLLKNKIESKEEAISAILKYNPDAITFLKRKVVTRDCLFFYLHENDIHIKLPTTKDKLINEIIKYWSCGDEENYNILQIEDSRTRPQKSEAVSISLQNNTIQIQNEDGEVDLMAEKFTEWFYSMMNQSECMETEHFYPDIILKIDLINNDQKITQSAANNVDEVVQLLFKVKSEHNLFFNPNISREGTKGKRDPHGLVIIKSCGTLHVNNTICGVFQQTFALARDPFSENNWKIKNTHLILTSGSGITQQPRLCDTISEQLVIRELQ